ncbi:unnamed protein product [Musa hybrid cultivar]
MLPHYHPAVAKQTSHDHPYPMILLHSKFNHQQCHGIFFFFFFFFLFLIITKCVSLMFSKRKHI